MFFLNVFLAHSPEFGRSPESSCRDLPKTATNPSRFLPDDPIKHIWSRTSYVTHCLPLVMIGRALVRLQSRQPLVVREAEGEVVRAFKEEMKQQRAMIIKALSDVSAFGEDSLQQTSPSNNSDLTRCGITTNQTSKDVRQATSSCRSSSTSALPNLVCCGVLPLDFSGA